MIKMETEYAPLYIVASGKRAVLNFPIERSDGKICRKILWTKSHIWVG